MSQAVTKYSSALGEVLRERRRKGLRQTQNMLRDRDRRRRTRGTVRPAATRPPGRESLGSSSGAARRRAVGDQQRGQRAAVAKDDVAEAAALIDTRMPLQQFERSVDRRRLERRQRGVRRTVAASGLFERDRPLGETELDGAILVIAGRLARQRGQARSRDSSGARTPAAGRKRHARRQRPPRLQHRAPR